MTIHSPFLNVCSKAGYPNYTYKEERKKIFYFIRMEPTVSEIGTDGILMCGPLKSFMNTLGADLPASFLHFKPSL